MKVIDLARARRYKALFLRYDTDNSREMNSTKLKNMMEKIGLPKVNFSVLLFFQLYSL